VALRFMDGFDHYATADVLKKWTSMDTPTISAGNGRRSTSSFRNVGNSRWLQRVFDNQNTWIAGFASRITSYPTATCAFLAFIDTSTTQVDLAFDTVGHVVVRRGGSTVLGTSTATFPLAAYRSLECAVTISSTVGSVTVLVDGSAIVTLTGINTQQSALGSANAIRLGCLGTQNFGTHDIDDVYLCDGTGSAPHNTFLGDCRVDTLFPNAEGSTQQWTPSTAVAHSTLVDEATPNTTDYVASSTPTHRELFGLQDLTAQTGTLYGVQLGLAVLKSDAGARSLKGVVRSGASDALGSTVALSTSQLYTLQVQTTDPATSAAWTEAAVNSVQVGAEVA
jgi:hypothetical protein